MATTVFAADPVSYVNPLMGTQSSFALSAGNTYPAIARPWGMNFWTPQTGKMGDGWQYTYDAHKICGFKQTHQPSPWINDYGQFSLMPIVGQPIFDAEKRASWFSHKAEIAQPHYYQVYLANYDVTAELTPTERAAMFRFTFPATDSAYVVLDAFDKGSAVEINAQTSTITGYSTRNNGGVPDNFKCYFVVQFDRPFTYSAEQQPTADHAGAIVGFKTKRGERVHVRVASSFVSAEQAEQNLKELGSSNFDALVAQGREVWNATLGKAQVEGAGETERRTFYSCLYRSLLFPRKMYEITPSGDTVHYSPYNGTLCKGTMYTDVGFWDVFRAQMPLLNLLYPAVSREMQEGFLNAYRESGFFPEWCSPGHRNCMVGNNSASVMVDAYMKGIRVADTKTLYEGLVHGTESVHPKVGSSGRKGFEQYNKLGYVPNDIKINESAARTLEYAYDDWCIYRLAVELGRPKKEIDKWATRAMNYKNLFDPTTRLMRGKKQDGKFAVPFSPFKWGGDFTEGNSWHYTWSVFHDPQGLITLMGSDANFVAMLDSVFQVPPIFDDSYYGQVIHEIREMQVMNMGNYAHGNQPIQHMIYLYPYAGEGWKTQYWVREVLRRLYSPTPDGYCGDEDNGQTSAWYVFSAMGFYPVCPGSNQYVLGSPLFNKVTLHLESGKTFTIAAPNNNEATPYVRSLQLNAAPFSRTYLTHEEITAGGTLNVEMDNTPNKTTAEERPYSFSANKVVKKKF
ncbi:alpha-1 2-mannosidase [Bacteroidia bacterium]|nr:alpha-1 2-mannosidase [Bacteroidia bacterium]